MGERDCPFCQIEESQILLKNDLCFAIFDKYPVNRGHILIIPFRHVPTYFDASWEEKVAILELIERAKEFLDREFKPDGYNIGVNVGKAAGQTIMHLHVHVIPRYRGDTEDPTGGVRNVIPERGNYRKFQKGER